MRILVTGASGFLGGRAAAVLAADHQVVGTGRVFPPERRRLLEGAGMRLDLTRARDELGYVPVRVGGIASARDEAEQA